MVAAASVCGAAAQAAPPAQIAYTVTIVAPEDADKRHFHVTAAARGATDGTVSFVMPAWSPGWYVLTHAYRNVGEVTATDEAGHSLPVTHPDQYTWTVTNDVNGSADADGAVRGLAHTITVSYDLAARDPDPDALFFRQPNARSYGFFAPYLDETNGFVPGVAALLYVDGAKAAPCSVTYQTPPNWSIASGNDPTANPNTFTAPNYDTLADQPADLGRFFRWDRKIDGVPVSVIIVGGEGLPTDRWVDSSFKIAAAGIHLMGDKPPFPRYLFQYRFSPAIEGGGGLEHRNGTVIQLPPSSLRDPGGDDMELIAHEFFHAWNVKRVRPLALGPFDYLHPVRIADLWWLEGATDNFALILDEQAGVVAPDFWRTFLSREITILQNNPARKSVTLETASQRAWEGKSEGYGGLTYYNKGSIVTLLLDIEMRRRTENRVGIPDLMRALYAETGPTGPGYAEGEIERLASKLTGSDMKPFFDRAIRSTEELPYADILPAAGLTLTITDPPEEGGERDYRLNVLPSPTPQQAAILAAVGGLTSPPAARLTRFAR